MYRNVLFFIVVTLISIGIVMIYSTSAIFAEENYADSYYYLKRQAMWVAIGLIWFSVAVNVDYHKLRRYSTAILLAGLGLLVLVFVPGIGRSAGGARRWLAAWGLGFQPSELAKFSLILFLADALARNQRRIEQFKPLMGPFGAAGLVLALIIMQPDLGTTVLIGLIAGLMLFAAGVRLRYLFSLMLGALPAVYILIFGSGYRKRRIAAFLNPWADPEGSGFQIIQSYVALGSGGLTGLGLAQSRQKFYYLPAAHTDFIFSIIGEELGIIGSAAIVALFLALFVIGMRICVKAPDWYGYLLSLGLVSVIALQAIINIAVVTGAIPTKGLPLPFVSFGGSNMVFNLFSVGVMMNIGKHMEQGRDNLYMDRHSDITPRI